MTSQVSLDCPFLKRITDNGARLCADSKTVTPTVRGRLTLASCPWCSPQTKPRPMETTRATLSRAVPHPTCPTHPRASHHTPHLVYVPHCNAHRFLSTVEVQGLAPAEALLHVDVPEEDAEAPRWVRHLQTDAGILVLEIPAQVCLENNGK